MNRIEFTPQVLYYLPIYIEMSWSEITTKKLLHYSKYYLYRLQDGTAKFTPQVQTALNELFFDTLGLDYSDLQCIYKIIEIIESRKGE